MLTTLWLRLGTWLGKLLLALIVLGLLGWALTTGWYAWKYRGPVSAQEQIPAGEAAMTQDTIQTAIKIVDLTASATRAAWRSSCRTCRARSCCPASKGVVNRIL